MYVIQVKLLIIGQITMQYVGQMGQTGEFNVVVLVQKEVFDLEVTMDDALGVTTGHCCHYLPKLHPCLLLTHFALAF